ncbi:MAG: hypothetical protein HC869_21715, partial [Rhodospirillales bacterium]|nr:hypothetical protein [Rhodospirillales bacterium]
IAGVEALAPGRPIQFAQAGSADTFTLAQKAAIERIIKDYLLVNPELLLDMQTALDAKMDKIQAERARRHSRTTPVRYSVRAAPRLSAT